MLKISFRGIFMVKANHLPRYVKGDPREHKQCCRQFCNLHRGRCEGSILDLYGTTWNRGSNIKWSVNTINYNTFVV